MNSITPLMKQYLDIKSQHKDKVLMFRLGDFYEMFYDDAKIASSLLNIALTARNKKAGNYVPMCGIPHHSVSSYISKLLAHGHKVALCDQVEDAKFSKGIVKRAVTRILSPGMVYDPETLKALRAHYLCSFDETCIAFLDLSTGDAFYYSLDSYKKDGNSVFSFIFLLLPVEIVLKEAQKEELKKSEAGRKVLKEFHITLFDREKVKREDLFERELSNSFEIVEKSSKNSIESPVKRDSKKALESHNLKISFRDVEGDIGKDVERERNGMNGIHQRAEEGHKLEDIKRCNRESVEDTEEAIQFLRAYVQSTQGEKILRSLSSFEDRTFQNQMMLSSATCQHLEIFQSHYREEKGSFFQAISRTKTSQGGRLLRDWISFPLINKDLIERRQEEVAFWVQQPIRLKDLRKEFSHFLDLERAIGKLSHPHLNARDLVSIKKSLIKGLLILSLAYKVKGDESASPFTLRSLESSEGKLSASAIEELVCELDDKLLEDAPISTKQGGMIKKGVSSELDQWIELTEDSRKKLLEMEARERKATHISSLKIRYNQVFGYYIEVTHAHKDKVPSSYERKQTLAQAERFVTHELKALEIKLLHAKEEREKLEWKLFEELRLKVLEYILELKTFSSYLSQVDVLTSLAWLALELDYTRPLLSSKGEASDELPFLELESARHPVLEQELQLQFVSNHLKLGPGMCLLLTGPNMAGKSTILRQVALISILAQIGSFVPAKKARLPIFTSIFTRIGANDHLSEGLSTFMLEMKETVNILKKSDSHSLVVLDEIGRGTSTYDGLSLAQALLEFLVLERKPYILFATHYHELTNLSKRFSKICNFHMKISEKKSSSSAAASFKGLELKKDQRFQVQKNGQEDRDNQKEQKALIDQDQFKGEDLLEEGEEEIEFLYKLSPGEAKKSYGIFVAKLAGFPPSVIQRARVLLKSFESRKPFL